jgi:hypothetical protein
MHYWDIDADGYREIMFNVPWFPWMISKIVLENQAWGSERIDKL